MKISLEKKVLPKTIKKTARTVVVEIADGRKIKIVKRKSVHRLSGHKGMSERERHLTDIRWSAEELGLVDLDRLEMEKELLNLNGWELEKHWRSMPEWNLAQQPKNNQ